jgi:hypothetical protein
MSSVEHAFGKPAKDLSCDRPSRVVNADEQKHGQDQMRYPCGQRVPPGQPQASEASEAEYYKLIARGNIKRRGKAAVGKRSQKALEWGQVHRLNSMKFQRTRSNCFRKSLLPLPVELFT